MLLNLSVTFAAKRYHGRINDEELEFPPSPSRLFQALIAGSHCGVYNLIHTEKRDHALQWLETLNPPEIAIPSVSESGRGITNFVPNNDNQLLQSHLPNSGHIRTAKSFLAKIFPDDNTLQYRWRFERNLEAQNNAQVICSMAKLITHLGQHQDTVYACGEIVDDGAVSAAESQIQLPSPTNDGKWTSPTVGALQAYQQRYNAWLNGDSKDNVMIPSRRVHYRPSTTIIMDAPMALFEMWRNEDERLRYYPRDLCQPAAMVRHAMIEWLAAHPAFREYYGEELTTPMISGHDGDQQHNGAHIACVPIPSLHETGVADGLIRRVLVIGFGCQDKTARELFESVTHGINGAVLLDNSVKIGYLKMAGLHDSVLSLFTHKACRVWRSVTPIILTGLMRRGRGAEPLIWRALKQAGFDDTDIDSIAAFRGPIVPKTDRALEYRVKGYLNETPRYHAEIIFKRPVEGMLVLGRGRHRGFGLMMPVSE